MSVFNSMQCTIRAGVDFDTAARQTQSLSFSHGCPCEFVFNDVIIPVTKDTILEDLRNEYYKKLAELRRS
jgi:hypothetical protein